MTGHYGRARYLHLVVGFAAGICGAVATSCTHGEQVRSVCVKQVRACDLHPDDQCEVADECVPAEAFGADAFTDCEDGQCVWDCSDGETCPDGWACVAQQPTLVELIHGC